MSYLRPDAAGDLRSSFLARALYTAQTRRFQLARQKGLSRAGLGTGLQSCQEQENK